MKFQQLGQTGIQVSSLCLGAMYFGSRNDEATSHRLLDQYVDAGGSFIDTANIYSHWVEGFRGGESETLLGAWMKARGNRDRIFLASKVGFGYGDVPKRLRASDIQQECDKSLRRLQVDTIDLYYAHVDDRTTPLEESLEAMNRLVDAGKVRFIGASNYLAWRLEQARWISETRGWAKFCCVQQHYTFLKLRGGMNVAPQEMANDDLLDYVANSGLTLLAYSVLQSGAYTRPERGFRKELQTPDNGRRLETLAAVAAETGATVNQVILKWMMNRSVIPLIAASSSEQLAENIGALDVDLTADQMDRLNRAGVDWPGRLT
ncbi:MAG: aldo/keto reductase [Chloroflexi bacterium]|nr:aldo/keto reductase [Chloroflexota bacterium]